MIYTIMGLSSVIIVILSLLKKLKSTNVNLKEYIANLEKENSKLEYALKKDKEVYQASRQAMLAKHESDKLMVEKYQKELTKFSDKQAAYYDEMDNVDNHAKEMSPEEFIRLAKKAQQTNTDIYDFTGIYILENKTMDKFYVGQSISVLKRASAHFMGKGNMDIYEDYKNGEIWTVRVVALSNSGFKSINALEKHFIKYHSSTYNGYNRTVGNVH